MIDDEWWIGHVINKSPASELYPHSSFMVYEIGWNNGEQERMSPWDMEPIDPESKYVLKSWKTAFVNSLGNKLFNF